MAAHARPSTPLTLAGLVALLPLAGACATPNIALAPGLAAAPPVPVTLPLFGRPLAFGPYSVRDVEASGVTSWKAGLFGVTVGQGDTDVRFEVLRGDDVVWRGYCVQRRAFAALDVSIVRAQETKNALDCKLDHGRLGFFALSLVRAGHTTPLEGAFTNGTRTFSVRSTHDAGGVLATRDPAGYLFDEGSEARAAIQTITPARLWIAPSARDDEELLAGAIAAAMNYRSLDDSVAR
ncbi:hypothetical protein L6R52_11170 [Myxococcota bacterium]|nr:hypothetical protein [Myxococcota bacterium]